jgi:proline dehydrogenase
MQLFEISLEGGTSFTHSQVHNTFAGFNSLEKEYKQNLENFIEKKCNDETSSEELTGSLKIWLIENIEEIQTIEAKINESVMILQAVKQMLNTTRLLYKHDGLDRIERIIQFRKIYGEIT